MSFLDDTVREVQNAVEQRFLFRKLGLPFDYASSPDDFPSKAFATAKEARAALPDIHGRGSGYAYSCRNHAMLFDSYLLRMELGLNAGNDEQILDRLIGGLIRLATVAPKAFLVGGLAPDGRGFYAGTCWENHAAWAFAASRGMETSAVAPESQEKFRSIAGKWADRLRRDKYVLKTIDGKPLPDADLSAPGSSMGPMLLATVLTLCLASREEKDREEYAALAEENGRSRLGQFDGLKELSPERLLWRQTCLSIIFRHDPDAGRRDLAREGMVALARVASKRIDAWRGWDPGLVDANVELDWRGRPPAESPNAPFAFSPHQSWLRMEREQPIEESLNAMYAVLLAGDRELAECVAEPFASCLGAVPWGKVMTLSALAPVVAVHARGLELGLWDQALLDSRRMEPASEMSFAAKYLEPDYDEANPGKAGHSAPPPGKNREPEPGKGGGEGKRRKRRRRR